MRKWSYDTHRNKDGWYNKELQYYSAGRPENVRLENGSLIIGSEGDELTASVGSGGRILIFGGLTEFMPGSGFSNLGVGIRLPNP